MAAYARRFLDQLEPVFPGSRRGNVHFAAEDCSQDFQGYMEGGASEGVRAGGEILADLKK